MYERDINNLYDDVNFSALNKTLLADLSRQINTGSESLIDEQIYLRKQAEKRTSSRTAHRGTDFSAHTSSDQ